MPEREVDPDIAAVQRLRDHLAAEIVVQQQRLEGVDLALRILNGDDKERTDQ
jgi:hypothetical protein